MDRRRALARSAKSLPPVLHLRLSGEGPQNEDATLLLDLINASSSLRAYVEFFDPLTGAYRIVLLGRLRD